MSNPYVPFEWKDRDSEYPTRRKLVDTTTLAETQVIVSRDEGTVTETGTPFESTRMNDLESRIYAAFGALTKEVTGTLTAGETTLVLTDAEVTTTSRVEGVLLDVDPFSTGIAPLSCVVGTGTITLTFEAQATNLGVIVEVRV